MRGTAGGGGGLGLDVVKTKHCAEKVRYHGKPDQGVLLVMTAPQSLQWLGPVRERLRHQGRWPQMSA